MDYLKKFNLSDFDVVEIITSIDDMDINHLYVNEEKVIETLNYFDKLGIKNIKELIINKSYLLYESIDDIKSKIEALDVEDLVNQLNNEVENCELI
ncbi:MAG: hypothetical protein IJ966_06595 [Bacilli bacterium]|jgi:hypothetical protein|nr:hypothetical protein [Bacilli bacterium]